ncbi:Kelch repeat type 1 [Dillenia turbinata]|uniref:Kelch repeat type 1 n=1 Tax=Dillenia turbinata TaxID=194707 RepID=A0AAN8V7X0_9MAGN
MRWERVQAKQNEDQHHQYYQHQMNSGWPGKRWGHTCNAIKGGKLLYVFGGYCKDNCQTNQVHVFDTARRTWSEPVIKGTPPTPRDSHSCTTVGDNLFVFGGTDGMNPLKDLHILDTSSHTWISPMLRGEGPEAREGHSAALVGKRLFIFGGCGKSANSSDEVYYNDLYILNTETFVWKRAITSGIPPSPRDSHTCSSWRNKLIVIGGEDQYDYYLSDVHVLDADALVWEELKTSGQTLPPRAGHSTVALGRHLFVFGGFTDAQNLYDDLHMLNVDSGLWTKVSATGEGPSARFSIAGDCLDPLKGGVLVFVGGCNKHLEALDDMYYLYTVRERDERNLEKLSLRKQLKLKCQEQQFPVPVNDKALVTVGNVESYRPMPVPITSQAIIQPFQVPQFSQGKSTFQARIINTIAGGYTIETVINGKRLRGIVFSTKPNSFLVPNENSSRKRPPTEFSNSKSNNDEHARPKAAKSLKQDGAYDRVTDGVHGKNSSCDTQAEAAATVMKDPSLSDVPQPHKAAEEPQPLAVGSSENGRAQEATNSSMEVPEVNSSPKMKDGEILLSEEDGRAARSEDQNGPAPA